MKGKVCIGLLYEGKNGSHTKRSGILPRSPGEPDLFRAGLWELIGWYSGSSLRGWYQSDSGELREPQNSLSEFTLTSTPWSQADDSI